MPEVLFAHGLEGHPDGAKSRVMRDAGWVVHAPDGRKQSLSARVRGLRDALRTMDRPVLVGSSFGGLAMLALARMEPGAFTGMVLCAPALTWNEQPAGPPGALVAPPATVVLHGAFDAIIPIGLSRSLVARSPNTRLIEVDDGHRLSNSLHRLVGALEGWRG